MNKWKSKSNDVNSNTKWYKCINEELEFYQNWKNWKIHQADPSEGIGPCQGKVTYMHQGSWVLTSQGLMAKGSQQKCQTKPTTYSGLQQKWGNVRGDSSKDINSVVRKKGTFQHFTKKTKWESITERMWKRKLARLRSTVCVLYVTRYFFWTFDDKIRWHLANKTMEKDHLDMEWLSLTVRMQTSYIWNDLRCNAQ